MRMRRKRNLDERLAAQKLILVIDRADLDARAAAKEKAYLNYAEIFGNDNPIGLEIGCGKGGFVREAAIRHKDVNFLAVEKLSNVIIDAVETTEAAGLNNVRFLNSGAAYLERYISPSSVTEIYVNFPTPLPNSPREKQRLTAPAYLNKYMEMLIKGGKFNFKTDKEFLYEYTLCKLRECGFVIEYATTDLHADTSRDNIVTEYEKKFSDAGDCIYAITAAKPL